MREKATIYIILFLNQKRWRCLVKNPAVAKRRLSETRERPLVRHGGQEAMGDGKQAASKKVEEYGVKLN